MVNLHVKTQTGRFSRRAPGATHIKIRAKGAVCMAGSMGAFLIYIDDWTSSTKIALMNGDEERGYLRLLMYAWKQPDCGLPDDDKSLSVISLLGKKWMRGSGAKLRDCFVQREGRLYSERLLREWLRKKEYDERKGLAAKTAADARWSEHRRRVEAETTCDTHATRMPDAMRTQCVDDAWNHAWNMPPQPQPQPLPLKPLKNVVVEDEIRPVLAALNGFVPADALIAREVYQLAISIESVTPHQAAWAIRWSVEEGYPVRSAGLFKRTVPEFMKTKYWQALRWYTETSTPLADRVREAQKVLASRKAPLPLEQRISLWLSLGGDECDE
jgi:uncharacterized protein YdaU (DUF1376 family)